VRHKFRFAHRWMILWMAVVLAACTLPGLDDVPFAADFPTALPGMPAENATATWTPFAPLDATDTPIVPPSVTPVLPTEQPPTATPLATLPPTATPYLSPTPWPTATTVFVPTAPPATPTRRPAATATRVPPTSVPPTAPAPTATRISPTATRVPPTSVPPTATTAPRPTATPVPPTATAAGCSYSLNTSFEQQLLNLINQERKKRGIAPLRMDSRLVAAARLHSQDMGCKGFFSHTGSDGSSPFDRMQRAGYTFSAAAENIYAGNGSYNSPQAAFNGWMNSQGHRENMLNPRYVDVGIGYVNVPGSPYGGYFTADFGKP